MRTGRVWFVKCPTSGKWHPGLHPQIYHICPDCEVAVHSEHYDHRTHEVKQATFRYQRARDYSAALDRVIADPEGYIEGALERTGSVR